MKLLQQLSRELEELVASTAPAVCGVEHRRGQGSGFVLAPDGYILTNHHVVRRQREVRVITHSGRELKGAVVGGDAATDLALVRVDANGLACLPLTDPHRIEVGQLVVAIGNPLRFERSVAFGVVSALDRVLTTPDGHAIEGVVQTDAAINPGNSGGPLINAWGEVVGINTAIVAYAQGIGFAIPAETANWVAALLIKNGRVERRYLGIAAKAAHLSPELAAATHQPRAVRVLAVADDSPAQAAGLREGDLLLSMDGQALRGVGDLHRLLATGRRERVELRAWQGGAVVLLEARPSSRRAA